MDKENRNLPSLSPTESDEWTRLIEQGQIANSQSQPWSPRPTAFDHPASSRTITAMEDETPTRPVTPSRIAAEDLPAVDGGNLVQRPVPAPALPHAQLCVLIKEKDKSIAAGKTRCAVCGIGFTAANAKQRVKHFNGCWMKFRNTVERKHMDSSRPLHVSDPGASEKQTCARDKEGANTCIICGLCLEGTSSIDAFEHHVFCQRARKLPLTACPRCDTQFTTDGARWDSSQIVEHIYTCSVHSETSSFDSLQAAWNERHSTRKDPSNCAFCSALLSHLDHIDAFHHRRKCLEKKRPVHCPVCFDHLPCFIGEKTWTPGDVHWHVHSCQHNGQLSDLGRVEFKILEAQWEGRIQSVCRRFNQNYEVTLEPRKRWTYKEHQASYRKKIASGRDEEVGLYLTPCSRLGSVEACAEDGEFRMVTRNENRAVGRSRLEKFRRSACEVYKMPDHGGMISCLKSEQVTEVAVEDWLLDRNVELLDDKASVGACVEQLSLSNSTTAPSCSKDEEERGSPRICDRRQIQAGRTTSRDR